MDLNVELHLGWGSCRNVVIVSVVVSVFVTVFNKWQIICICLVWWWLSEAGLSRWKGEMQKAQVWHFGPLTQEARGAEALWGWHFESSQNFSSPTLTFFAQQICSKARFKTSALKMLKFEEKNVYFPSWQYFFHSVANFQSLDIFFVPRWSVFPPNNQIPFILPPGGIYRHYVSTGRTMITLGDFATPTLADMF